MGESGHRQQGDDCAIVRQRIHAAGGHRGDAMHHLQRNSGGMRIGDEGVGHGAQSDAHAAGRRSGNAGQSGDRDGFVDQRVWNCMQCIGDQRESRAALQ